MEGDMIDIGQLLGLLTQLALRAAVVAKQCAQDPSLKTFQKKADDPVTEADFKIQTMIVKALNHFYPPLRIVGEQTIEYEGHIDLDLAEIKSRKLPFEEEKVPIKELCAWIDPIDNTKGFIKGQYDCITILLGVSRNCKAYAGVVGLPYQREGADVIFRPTSQVGLISQSKTFLADFDGFKDLISTQHTPHPHFLYSGSQVAAPIVNKIVTHHKGKITIVAGAGIKPAMVALGKADGFLYINSVCQKWDCCANEAIIKSMGGCFTDDRGRAIIYDPDLPFAHDVGTITTMDHQLHKTIIGIIREEKAYDV